jgi:hypothetical protein
MFALEIVTLNLLAIFFTMFVVTKRLMGNKTFGMRRRTFVIIQQIPLEFRRDCDFLPLAN